MQSSSSQFSSYRSPLLCFLHRFGGVLPEASDHVFVLKRPLGSSRKGNGLKLANEILLLFTEALSILFEGLIEKSHRTREAFLLKIPNLPLAKRLRVGQGHTGVSSVAANLLFCLLPSLARWNQILSLGKTLSLTALCFAILPLISWMSLRPSLFHPNL